jgi:hypothetical protein
MKLQKRGRWISLLMLIGLAVFWSVAARVNPFKVLLFNRQIRFVGRVVDQFGQPVPGARVTIQFGQAVPLGMYQRVTEDVYTTDRKGYFSIRWRLGIGLLVTKIDKRGYEYSVDSNIRVTGWDVVQPPGPAPSWTAPAVFHLRKRGETAHLMTGEFTFGFGVDQSGVEYGYDLIRGDGLSPKQLKDPSLNGEPLCCDLLFKGIWKAKDRTWSVVFAGGTPGGGVMISDQLLYQAPDNGYQPSITLAPTPEDPSRWEQWKHEKDQHPGLRYLYVRSRNPYLYSRIDLGANFDVNDWPFIRRIVIPTDRYQFTSWTNKYVINPYGDRVLDEEPDLPGGTRLKLNENVRKAYRFNVNGHPLKPDITSLRPPSGR